MTDHAAIEAAAASWLMRRNEPDWTDQDQRAFEAWMAEAMAHKAAFWRLEHGYAQLDRLSALPSVAPALPSRLPGMMRAFAIAASLLLLVTGGYLVFTRSGVAGGQAEVAHYSTGFGQIQAIALPDGSTVQLNSESSVRVALNKRERLVQLDRGEAYFSVAADAERPFVIRADPGEITVVGTKFSVIREAGKVKVAVLEGRVRLSRPRREDGGPLMLAAGDVGVTDGWSIEATSRGIKRIGDDLAWREGMVRFDNIRLADAAARFNRYNRRKLMIVDPEARDLRIGGAFRLGNVDGFVRLVNQAYGFKLKVSEPDAAPLSH
jgi:transmembrane sensor